MVGISEMVAGLSGSLPTIFEPRDAAFIKRDGSPNAFGASLHA